MNPKPSICDLKVIGRFLAGDLDDQQQRSFEAHLDECDACCRRLREETAAADQWGDVQRYLSSDGLTTSDGAGGDPTDIPLDFLSPADDPRMLGRFGGYDIAGVVGQGGMGIVLKAFDHALNRYSAIKVLAPHFASSAAARKRFAREAQAAAAVVHDNVIAIHGVDQSSNLPFLVMPYVRGESLQRRIDRVGALSVPEVLRIAMQTAQGLAAAHAQGLVHRDIKPANILLPDGVERVILTDFGLARAADDASLTRSGVIAGTPQYMSPEQARGDVIDARSDLFSLGSVLYTMCTGRIPFRAETPYGILRRISDDDPRPIREINPQVPPWLVQIVDQLHAKSPEERLQSASEAASRLQLGLAYLQTPGGKLPSELAPASRRRSPAAASILAGVAVLLVTCLALYWQGASNREGDHSEALNAIGTEQPESTGSGALIREQDVALPGGAAVTHADSSTAWNDSTGHDVESIQNEALRLAEDASQPFDSTLRIDRPEVTQP